MSLNDWLREHRNQLITATSFRKVAAAYLRASNISETEEMIVQIIKTLHPASCACGFGGK
jgi:hypothetical protein